MIHYQIFLKSNKGVVPHKHWFFQPDLWYGGG